MHLVEAGENLYQISLIYGVDWQTVAARNNLFGAGDIRIGQTLEIPASGAGPPPILGAPPLLPTTHRVRPGENLYRIGLIYGIPWPTLAVVNGLWTGESIVYGQILIIQAYLPPPVQLPAPQPTEPEASLEPTATPSAQPPAPRPTEQEPTPVPTQPR